MKRLLAFLSIFLFSFMLAACASTQVTDTPKSVALRAVDAVHKGDTDTVFALIKIPEDIKNKKGGKDALRGKLKILVTKPHKKTKEKGGIASIVASQPDYSHDKKRATVHVVITFNNGDTQSRTIPVIWDNNRWLLGE